MTTLGSAIVTCPACGESIPIVVMLESVTLVPSLDQMYVKLGPETVRHECKGRA